MKFFVRFKCFYCIQKIILVFGISFSLIASAELRHNKNIIDAHIHLDNLDEEDFLEDGSIPHKPSQEIIDILDSRGVGLAFILSNAYIFHYEFLGSLDKRQKLTVKENNYNIEQAQLYPSRFLAFCSFPFAFTMDWIEKEIERCKEAGAVGVKLHLANNENSLKAQSDQSKYSQILKYAKNLGLVVLNHPKVVDRQSWENVLLPSLAVSGIGPIIFAHGLTNEWRQLDIFPVFADPSYYSNIYFDTSALLEIYATAPLSLRSEIVWHLKLIGVEHILYGSDLPAYNKGPEVLVEFSQAVIGDYGFSNEEIEMILSKNAEKLLASQAPLRVPWRY